MKRTSLLALSLFSFFYTPPVGAQDATKLVINEIVASNIDGTMSPATNFDSWVEFFNPTATDIPLGGMFLSNNPEVPTLWQMPDAVGTVPANGHKVVWLGSGDMVSTQAPFKLSCDGGTILLSDADGHVLAREDYPEALSRTAWARTSDGAATWGTTAMATPGQSNNEAVFASERLEPPVVSADSRFFTESFGVTVQIPDGCTLRYTTNGSLPTDASPESPTGLFTVSATQSLRFRLFREGYLPSVPVTRSYIKAAQPALPVVSIVGDQRYFTDAQIGIAVAGSNGTTGHGRNEKRNWNQDWERPVNFSYMLPSGEMAFNQDAEIAVSGAATRYDDPKSFKLKSGKEFDGQNTFPYPFFDQKPFIRNKTLVTRNGGNDNVDGSGGGQYKAGRFRDPAIQTVLFRSGIDLDVQAYQPIVRYVNGRRDGVINLREPNNKKYVAANYGYDDEEIDFFEENIYHNLVVSLGTDEVLNRIFELARRANLTAVYQELCQLLDMDEYINYMAMQLFLCSKDWPHNNMKGFRLRPHGRYRMITFDLDLIFRVSNPFENFANEQWYRFLTETGQNRSETEEIGFVTLFLNLLQNMQFRRQFVDTYCLMAGSVFDYERTETILNELADRVRPEMQHDGMSPDGALSFLLNGLRNHAPQMMACMRQFAPMQLDQSVGFQSRLSADTEGTRLFVNDVEVPYAKFRGELIAPVRLRAETPAGFRFAGWKCIYEHGGLELFGMNSTWRYYDQGDLSGTRWKERVYSAEGTWPEGQAPLGYNMEGVHTTLDYGGNASQKRPTYYFRQSFTLGQQPKSTDVFTLNYQLDDAMVVYVNGVEAARVNLPEGAIGYETYSTTLVGNSPQTGSLQLPSDLFRNGRNTVAVEVHNWKPTSGDIFFAAQLVQTSVGGDDDYYALSNEITLPTTGGQHFVACFVPMSDEERQQEHLPPVRINEVSAANSMAVSDLWKRSDWVEVYNTTNEEVNLEGMFLSNDPQEPHKWAFPSVVVPAHGHQVVWCDKRESATQMHASFNLPASGGCVVLSAADDSWRDSLAYADHGGDESVGCFPDGAAQVYRFSRPTIAARNCLSSYAEVVEQPGASAIAPLLRQPSSRLSASYVLGDIVVRSSSMEETALSVSVFTAAGQSVARTTATLREGYAVVPMRSLPKGVYVLRVAATQSAGKASGTDAATVKFLAE